jgi:hypothetical protein
LEVFFAFVIDVDDSIHAAIIAKSDAGGHRMSTDLCATGDGVRDMRDQRAGFGTNFAALKTKTAIDAVWPIAMRS